MHPDLEKKFIELYAKESDSVFRMCLMRTSNRDVAKDLTQDAFSKIWQSMQAGTDIENMRAFVFKISTNLVIDWYRKKKMLSLDDIIEQDPHADVPLMDDGAEMSAEMSSEARFLVGKIRELEPAYQRVVYLRFMEDLRPQEIAEALGESVNVISVRITRGLEKLRLLTGYSKVHNEGDEGGKFKYKHERP